MLFVLSILFTAFSCSKDEVLEYNKENQTTINKLESNSLKEDLIFIENINLHYKHVESIDLDNLNLEIANELLEKDDLSEEEIETLSKAIGFESAESFKNLINYQNSLLSQLEKKYSILAYPESELFDVVLETIEEKIIISSSSDPCNCGARRDNCIVAALTNAAILHIGCGILDVSIFGGLACHAIVTINHTTNHNECMYQYQDCIRNC